MTLLVTAWQDRLPTGHLAHFLQGKVDALCLKRLEEDALWG